MNTPERPSNTISLTERLVRPGSPFELIPAQSPAPAARVFRHAPASLNDMYQKATAVASRTCMHFCAHDITYAQILNAALTLALHLRRDHGIVPLDRVAVILPTCPQWLIAFIAVTSMGAVATLIERRDTLHHVLPALDLTKCSAVITDQATGGMLAAHGDRRARILVRNCSGEGPVTSLLSSFAGVTPSDGRIAFDTRSIDPEQEALIAFTTGSTSSPKGVISSHRAVIAGIMNMMLCSALASARNRGKEPSAAQTPASPSSLLLAPLTHVSGYSHLLLMMQVAGKVVPLPSWRADAAASLIEKHNLRSLSGANAAQLRELLRADPSNGTINSLLSIGLHGEALRNNILEEIRHRLPNAMPGTGYGLTETNGSICAAVGADLTEHPGTCGPVVPSVEMRTLDESGLEIPMGRTGDISVRGAMLMSGYCGAAASLAGVSKEGWLRTGDFGRIDRDGFLYLVERRQEVFHCGERTFSMSAIERCVYECGYVDEAAAIFVSAGGSAARLIVAAVPRNGTTGQEQQIAARLAREVPADRCKVEVVTLARLPRLPSGKVDRRALRQTFGLRET